MQETISTIIKQNSQLFGDNPQIKKINVGFTNTIFVVNDLYIIKICTNEDNENNFKNEINFYKENTGNNLLPKLYVSDIDKKDVPYCYEIIEKIDGVSLYNVWHTFSEDERENIIKQLCEAMKSIHSNKSKGQNFDWNNYLQNQFTELYSKTKTLNVFTEQEQKLIEYAFSKFSKYLKKEELVLVHNDLHFDNIFYKDGKIKIIDFERSMYAPKDFELDILYRMIRKPWKFASEETEQYTNSSDYTNIKLYIEKYYPELVNVEFLPQRLAIYDMIYYLSQLIDYPNSKELKNDIISAAKIVSLKDELNFENIENDLK
ncbi:aminoglycoside phosphotransferase [Bacillus sp. CAG:988]|nr:aminoglycoside phosphotransferase [Bacillus sp. CAG:988]